MITKRFEKFLWLIPALLAFVVHWPVLKNGFVYDDPLLIFTILPRLQSINDVWYYSKLFTIELVYYRPTFYITLILTRLFSDYEPWGYHLILLLIHMANVILVYILSLRFFKNEKQAAWGAFAASALFAVHPVHIEVVAWVSAIVEALLTLFFLSALIFHSQLHKKSRHKFWLLFSAASFFLALLSKETAAAFLILAPLYDFLFLTKEERKTSFLKTSYLTYFMTFLAYFVLRYQNVPQKNPVAHIMVQTSDGILRLITAFGYYLQKTLWPHSINPYAVNLPSSPEFIIGSIIFTALLFGLCAYTFKQERRLFFHLNFFIICLMPGVLVSWGQTSGLPLAERYLYLPSYGACFIFGWLLLRGKNSKLRIIKIGTATLILIACATLSFQRSPLWLSEVSFWKKAVKMNPRDVAPWSNLGRVAMQYNDHSRALAFFDKALSFKTNQIPNSVLAELYGNKAICLKYLDREDEGITMLEESIRLTPHPIAYFNLALLYAEKAKKIENKTTAKKYFMKAIKNFESSIELDQNSNQSHYHLAATHEALGNLSQAKKHYEICTKLKPEDAWTIEAKKALLNSIFLVQ